MEENLSPVGQSVIMAGTIISALQLMCPGYPSTRSLWYQRGRHYLLQRLYPSSVAITCSEGVLLDLKVLPQAWCCVSRKLGHGALEEGPDGCGPRVGRMKRASVQGGLAGCDGLGRLGCSESQKDGTIQQILLNICNMTDLWMAAE